MKALIVGGGGQLGRALAASAPAGMAVVSHGAGSLDVTDASAVAAVVQEVGPELLLNAAAYTDVDAAETDEAAAHAVNATAVGLLAQAARAAGARFVHVSTDFVFDGGAGSPYAPDAAPGPLGAYGRTKLAGERLAGADALIVRTAWLHAPVGGNFVRTMLRLMAQRAEVRVVADQIGTPTYAPGLAAALWTLAGQGVRGIHHYTDSGVASRYDFAVAIQEEAIAAGLLARAVPVIPIASDALPTPARRPGCVVLDTRSAIAALGRPAPHWRVNLRAMMAAIRRDG